MEFLTRCGLFATKRSPPPGRWTVRGLGLVLGCAVALSAIPSTARTQHRHRASAVRLLAINYQVPGLVPPIRQPNLKTCWATVATMMFSWENHASFSIEHVLDTIGGGYRARFDANKGLQSNDKADFLTRMALRSEGPQSHSIENWEALLRQFGPLWITTKESPYGFVVHARIITGIKGDGSLDGTSFTIVDPDDGAVHVETVRDFIRKFEQVAKSENLAGVDLMPQVVHY